MVQNLDKNNTDKKTTSKQAPAKESNKETAHSTKTGKGVIRRSDPSGLPKLR